MTSQVTETRAEEDLAAALRRVLAADTVLTLLTEGVLADSDQSVRDRVLAKAEQQRRALVAQADDIPMIEELHWTLACSYVELKSQWIQRQVRVCYGEMLTGACDPEVAAEASMISMLLGLVEPLLDERHLEQIRELFITQIAD